MSAPERIWANGLGVYGEYAGFGGTEYVRADLCDPTQERVRALIEALQGEDERGYRLSPEAYAALRALEQGDGKT